MDEDIDIEYKISNFKAITDLNSDDIAVTFLSENNWDEMQAANAYFMSLDKKISNLDNNKNNNKQPDIKSNINNSSNTRKNNIKTESKNDFHIELMNILQLPNKDKNMDEVFFLFTKKI